MTDPYQVLGVNPGASDDEVKRAYREMSRKYHPDTYANNPLSDLAEEKFKEVQGNFNLLGYIQRIIPGIGTPYPAI